MSALFKSSSLEICIVKKTINISGPSPKGHKENISANISPVLHLDPPIICRVRLKPIPVHTQCAGHRINT